MQKFHPASWLFFRINFMFFLKLFWKVVCNVLIDLESSNIVNYVMCYNLSSLDVFPFDFIFESKKFNLQ
mgnify:CR=1 FL=1